MKAVILAAGRGSRLSQHTDQRPKPLVDVAGKPILNRIIEALHTAGGVREFVIAAGYRAEDFKALKLPPSTCAEIVLNTEWEQSGSMLSLLLCVKHLREGGYIVEGDCCFDASLFDAAKELPGPLWYARPFTRDDDGCALWPDASGLIRRLSIEKKDSPAAGVARKSCGVLRITPELAARLGPWLQQARAAGRQKDYYDLVLADHLEEARLSIAPIGPAPWYEVDNEQDLQQADALFRRVSA